ncbi:hypothetical protein BH09GEM1_BH09GEM1_14500 [soil metagenome]
MFTTLVESRGVRRRSVRGAVISIVLHSLLIAAAVALTIPTSVDARPDSRPQPPVIYVPAPAPRNVPPPAGALPHAVAPPSAPMLSIPAPTIVPTSLPPIDFTGPAIPPERIAVGSGPLAPSALGGGDPTSALTPGAVLDAGVVDRVPRIIGNAPPPRYPDMLRQSGATGQVVVRFVVDTMGRAELGDIVVVDATHPLFASSVKTALMAYRFTPGEVAGRKVRTLVQVPFSFTLK